MATKKANSGSEVENKVEVKVDFVNDQDKFDPALSHVESHLITSIMELFTAQSQLQLSSFLRKKIIIKFNSIKGCSLEEIKLNNPALLTLDFPIEPYARYGIIAYDYVFLDFVINLLYGGTVNSEDKVPTHLGKSGYKIVSKISELILMVLQNSMQERLKIPLVLSEVSLHQAILFKNAKPDSLHLFKLAILLDSKECVMNLILPADLFLSTETQNQVSTDTQEAGHPSHDIALRPSIFDEEAKKNLIDSNITVSVQLAPVTIKLRDAVKLKEGDIIPISDPTTVFVAHNKKTLFRASSGQSNLRRVVRIIGPVDNSTTLAKLD